MFTATFSANAEADLFFAAATFSVMQQRSLVIAGLSFGERVNALIFHHVYFSSIVLAHAVHDLQSLPYHPGLL